MKNFDNNISQYFKDDNIISTDIYALNYILKGGFVPGFSYQIVGESGIGKSTLALQIANSLCNQGKKVIYVDSEYSVSHEMIKFSRLNEAISNNQLFYIRENNFESVEKMLDMIIDQYDISLIIIDSLAALIHKGFTDLKKGISITTNCTNYNSRQLSLFMSKYKSLSFSKNFSLLLINQFREKVDLTGTVVKEYGAKSVKYNSDIILKMSAIKNSSKYYEFKNMLKNENGNSFEFTVIKSNSNPPLKSIPGYLVYGKGISSICNYIYALIKLDIIKKKTSYYHFVFNNHIIDVQGINKLINHIINNEEIYEWVFEQEDKVDDYYDKC